MDIAANAAPALVRDQSPSLQVTVTRAWQLIGFGSIHQVREGKEGIRFASAHQGCTKGFHNKEKPPEPYSQEETSDKTKARTVEKLIIQGQKSAEKMQWERPR